MSQMERIQDIPETSALPQHVAVIMDGNGRWAESRHLPRFQGHQEGVKRVEEIISEAERCGIRVLTLFTFSTENWQRPPKEVSMLMSILCSVLDAKLKKLMHKGVRLTMIGRREGIPTEVMDCLDRSMARTRENSGMILNLAFNYGSRTEILDGVRQIAQQVRDGEFGVEEIDEDMFSRALYTRELPDPDLLIRTSGEQRISNFLLWQLSYAELYFTEKYWPDFTVEEFQAALAEYARRDRRYGRVR